MQEIRACWNQVAKLCLWFYDSTQGVSFFFIEFIFLLSHSTFLSLCSPFYWILLLSGFQWIFSPSLFLSKTWTISYFSLNRSFACVKRNRSAVRLSQDKSPLSALTVRKSLGYNQLPQSSSTSPQALIPVWQKEGENCIDLRLKFHVEKKHFEFQTFWVSMHV